MVSGGTSVEEKSRGPLLAAIAALAVIGLVAYVAMRGGDDKKVVAPVVAPTVEQPVAATPTDTPVPFQDERPRSPQPNRPDPATVAGNLERDLKHQRLWSNVTVTGNRVEVRSGSCGDAAMGPLLDAAAADFKAAGVTRMRCVEQSGRVVSDRDL